ncbi:hypothetical protein M378DRAFT_180723 [Amanita muscaria Koide BX008]|uniref:Uncharacterized protein n=1 Tax=Amanita muscaria (strain Koide BX008) TaxID=946122 RepID=A0A0C2WTP8_AMAMK|nr:hypothetical protein M378DRAFT_180723 [Amanita muscaria Koide BX008]
MPQYHHPVEQLVCSHRIPYGGLGDSAVSPFTGSDQSSQTNDMNPRSFQYESEKPQPLPDLLAAELLFQNDIYFLALEKQQPRLGLVPQGWSKLVQSDLHVLIDPPSPGIFPTTQLKFHASARIVTVGRAIWYTFCESCNTRC